MHQILTGLEHGAADGSPQQLSAQRLLGQLFPSGVGALTQSSILEQHYSVTHLVARLRSDLASDVTAAGLPAILVDRLASLTEQMQAAIHSEAGAAPTYEQVRESRQRAHRALLQVIAQIFASFGDDSPSHEQARAQLLAPVISANRQAKSRRPRASSDDAETEIEPIPTLTCT